jgi:hypothetical protein
MLFCLLLSCPVVRLSPSPFGFPRKKCLIMKSFYGKGKYGLHYLSVLAPITIFFSNLVLHFHSRRAANERADGYGYRKSLKSRIESFINSP